MARPKQLDIVEAVKESYGRNDPEHVDLSAREDVIAGVASVAEEVHLWEHNGKRYIVMPVLATIKADGLLHRLGQGLARILGLRFFNKIEPEGGATPQKAYRQGRADKHFKADVTVEVKKGSKLVYAMSKEDVAKLKRMAEGLDLVSPSDAAKFRERVQKQCKAFASPARKFGVVAARAHAEAYLKQVGGAV